MRGTTHKAIGFCAGAITGYLLSGGNPYTTSAYAVVSALSSPAPDWDTANQGDTLPVNPLGTLVWVVVGKFVKHRTFTHSLLGYALWMAFAGLTMWGLKVITPPDPSLQSLVSTFIPIVLIGNALGYGFHLFADYFTAHGIALFYPFKKERVKFVRTLSYGSFWESIITAVCGLLGSGIILYPLYRILQ